MIAKAFAIAAIAVLPLNVLFWYRSHHTPWQHRYDVTLYKSLNVYLREGVCGLHLLNMPTKTASRTGFEQTLTYNPTPNKASLFFSTKTVGPYRKTWLVFPFWLTTLGCVTVGAYPIVRGPLTQTWRAWKGLCTECGYNLTANRTGRCPECGNRFR